MSEHKEEKEKDRRGGATTKKNKKLPDKTSAGFAHLCQAERARPAVTGRRRRERLRGGGRREKEEEMEARCPRQQVPGIVLGGKMHHNEGGGWVKIRG